MKYYSEILKKAFDSEKACLSAEKDYEAKVSAEREAAEAKARKRKARAEEVEAAAKDAVEARKHYSELLAAFCKDYGAYHTTVHMDDLDSIFSNLADFFSL